MPRRWYKDAIVYSLDVETFMDSDGDGIGDFRGLTRQLPYIAGLGADTLWLLPFYPSPNRDNGYDVTDHYGVDPRLGTLGDFVEFMHEAARCGLRVIVDLVVNHTSDRHPWFRSARRDPRSPYRDYYVWSRTKPADGAEGVIFPGYQQGIWTFDRAAGAWYLHRFYRHQPDLNVVNPAVREEIKRIMGFWLELGVSGFRVDAAPFLLELKGVDGSLVSDPFDYLREFREFVSWRRGDALLLAEANVPLDQAGSYLGPGAFHMLFHFPLNQALFLALARELATPLVEALAAPAPLPDAAQWAVFLRTHDELDLGRLTPAQRAEVFRRFAPSKTMQLYERGIRRRLAPMLGGDPRRLRLAHSLLLTLPGTPVLRYGDEIGMGDDLSLPERESVRTPMQWSDDRHAGFSSAPARDLVHKPIRRGPFAYPSVNVARARRDPESLLNWIERAIRLRRECPEFGRGTPALLETGDPAVLAHACTWQDGTVVAVHNLSGKERAVHVDLSGLGAARLVGVLGHAREQDVEGGRPPVRLEPYGVRWYRVGRRSR